MRFLIAVALIALTPLALGQDNPGVRTSALSDTLYLLQGRGGNVVASVGGDGVLMIDDDYGQMVAAYQAALDALDAAAPRFVINTHWHGDHTGGNAHWGGKGAVIMAHHNVRERMSTRQDNKFFGRVTEPSPAAAWPVVTYGDASALHFNGDTLDIQHYPTGHTDGDSVVYFVNANVAHLGDHFFKDRFPFIDIGSGGSVDGFIANIDAILQRVDGETLIVPGHGSVANRADLVRYREMLGTTVKAIRAHKAAGLSVDDARQKGLDARWDSWGSGFIDRDAWIGIVYSDSP